MQKVNVCPLGMNSRSECDGDCPLAPGWICPYAATDAEGQLSLPAEMEKGIPAHW